MSAQRKPCSPPKEAMAQYYDGSHWVPANVNVHADVERETGAVVTLDIVTGQDIEEGSLRLDAHSLERLLAALEPHRRKLP